MLFDSRNYLTRAWRLALTVYHEKRIEKLLSFFLNVVIDRYMF